MYGVGIHIYIYIYIYTYIHTYIHTHTRTQILSANREAQISIEDLIGSFDLRKTITRSQLDMATDDLCIRASAPVTEVLNSVGLQLGDVDAVELIGNGWRMQRIQNEISNVVGENLPLGKSLNSDEFGANGAALAAMYLMDGMAERLRFEAWDSMPYEVCVCVCE